MAVLAITEFAGLGDLAFAVDVLPFPIEEIRIESRFALFHDGPSIEIGAVFVAILGFHEHRADGQIHSGIKCLDARRRDME